MIRTLAALALAAGLLVSLAAPVLAQGSKPVAKVDDMVVTEEDVAIGLAEMGASLPQQMNEAQRRNYIVEYLMDLKLVARAADREKLGDTPDFRKRLEQTRERLLMEALLTREGEKGATDEALKKFYDDTVKTLPQEKEIRARHILVETEDDAKKALERVKKGEDFAAVAKELSKDPGSGTDGGDLGFFTKDRMVAEFAEEAFKTAVGQISNIVKSQFGFHVIKVEEARDRAPPAFDQVKAQLQRYMVQKAQQDFVLELRKAARIERLDQPK
jgi:peptidyl-prolyl cis-trans isomerase C